jgi:hypothetical protein
MDSGYHAIDSDGETAPASRVDQVRNLIERHTREQAKHLAELEEQIALVGKRLDDLTTAREHLFAALRGTEKLRATLNGEPFEDEPEPRKISSRGM